MTPRQARRMAVYSTGLNRAWGITRTLKRTLLFTWVGATLALATAPREIEKEVIVREPFPLLDLAMCRDMVARNRNTDPGNVIPSQHTEIDDLRGQGVYNPKDVGIVAANIRAAAQAALERQKARDRFLLEASKPRRKTVVPKGAIAIN